MKNIFFLFTHIGQVSIEQLNAIMTWKLKTQGLNLGRDETCFMAKVSSTSHS